jgi:branched-chain amino acid transport system substrate-binding protein
MSVMAAATVLLAACGGGAGGGGPLTVAVLAPFTGGSSFIGSLVTAIDVPAAHEINQAGGILGHKLDLGFIDTKGDAADALPALDQYLATHTNVVGTDGPESDSAPTLVPILNRDKIPMISGAGESSFDHSSYQYFWRTTPPDSADGIAMAVWAKRAGYKNIALVFGNDLGSQGDLPGVVAGAKALGLHVVSNLTLTADQSSYSGEVARLLAARPKPQAILTEADPTTGATFYGELAQQDPQNIPIIGTEATVLQSWISAASNAVGANRFYSEFTGVAEATAKPNPAATIQRQNLMATKAKIPNATSYLNNPFWKTGYGNVILLALAMTAAHSTTGSVYNRYIASVTNPGPGKTVVYSYRTGVKLLNEGKKIQYVGPGGPYHFNRWHNSSAGQVAEQFQPNGKVTTRPNGTVSANVIESYG